MKRLFISQPMFRSTGSYEPDRYNEQDRLHKSGSFDPQALTSLTDFHGFILNFFISFDPQALTSLTVPKATPNADSISFDPQALTSLTC